MLAGVLLLAACSELDRPGVAPQAPRHTASALAARPAPPPRSPVPAPATDACGAAAHAYLVGRPKSEIPVPVDPSKRRVLCTTCPMTKDLRPDRLNILYEEKTGVITDVRCG